MTYNTSPHPERSDRFVLTSANLLLETNTSHDRHITIPQQHERLDAHIEALRSIQTGKGGRRSINVIGLQEVQSQGGRHNGQTIQRELGYRFGMWQPHSRKSHGEHIGVISNVEPDNSEAVRLDKNRYALSLRFGEACVVIVHQMFSDADRRRLQYEALYEYLEGEEHASVMGDFNEDLWQFGLRRKFGKAGLVSAFVEDGKGHPVTLPAPGYGKYRSLKRRIGYGLLGGGLCYDDIYVPKDFRVHATGTVDSESDHRFVWTDTSTPYGMYMDREAS